MFIVALSVLLFLGVLLTVKPFSQYTLFDEDDGRKPLSKNDFEMYLG